MMITNVQVKKAIVTSLFLAVALVLPESTWATAGSPQSCTVGATCEVGEFLYDDEYTPITTGTCNITAKYPDGTTYINDASMTPAAENDGWYSYEFTTPSTIGSYRTQVCCTVSGELLCLDKTFDAVEEVVQGESSEDIASSVWGYSNRSLTSFGSLASDIWGYSSRSLTSLGTLVRDIWISDERTLTSNSTSSSSGGSDVDLSSIEATVNENRLLLEQLVNEPIIVNFLEEEEDIDLNAKLKQTRAIANQIYVNDQYMTTKTATLVASWGKESNSKTLDKVMDINNLLGDETDSSSSDTVFGSINWMKDSWDWEKTKEIKTAAKMAKTNLDSAQASLASSNQTKSSYQNMKLALKSLVDLEKLIGNSTDSNQQITLYGKIKQVEEHVALLNERNTEVDELLAKWETTKTASTTNSKIDDIQRKVIAVNQVPRVSQVLGAKDKSEDPLKVLKNRLLGLKGIINTNMKLLALSAGDTLSNTWLEEGSIVFRTLATNPSKLINQEVEIKYYLPQEIREEDILSVDEGITISYDSETDKYYAEGKFKLDAGESRSFSVRVDDIWEVTQQEVDSIRTQAEELSRPLENTSFFAQGVTLKSDIDASLDKIITLQVNAVTPEQKIRAYREAYIEKQSAEQKLASLQDLVTQAGSTGTLFGFVGGAQTLAVWGLIIIMAVGFVFLALYMRTVTSKSEDGKKKEPGKKGKGKSTSSSDSEGGFDLTKFIKLSVPFAAVAIISASVTGLVVTKIVTNSVREEVLGQQAESTDSEVEDLSSSSLEEADEDGVGGLDIAWLDVPDGKSVNIREGASVEDDVLMSVKVSQEIIVIGEEDTWVNILIDNDEEELALEGWVDEEYVISPKEDVFEEDETEELGTVIVEETSTGWLRVRSTPGGAEIGMVYPGDKLTLVDENSEWYEIEFDEETTGWISKQYSSKE